MDFELAEVDVVNNEKEQRFEAGVGDHLAVIEYYYPREDTNTIVFTHTGVPDVLSGKGLASKMARVVLEYAVERSLKVVPKCRFLASYVREHPEYWPLVPPEYRGN